MPNGVSCAYFAAKNLKVGIKEKNIFRDGIAGIQTARTADAAVKSVSQTTSSITQSAAFTASKNILGKVASVAKKFLYPLIICSGIYNTAKSNDKVKTGVSQASAIGLMFGMEQLAEKTFLKKIDQRVSTTQNKKLKVGWYVLKGLTYAACSLTGYDVGNKVGQKFIDKIRGVKQSKNSSVSNRQVNDEEDLAKIIFSDIDNMNEPKAG